MSLIEELPAIAEQAMAVRVSDSPYDYFILILIVYYSIRPVSSRAIIGSLAALADITHLFSCNIRFTGILQTSAIQNLDSNYT